MKNRRLDFTRGQQALMAFLMQSVKIVRLEGGSCPARAHAKDVGFDCFTRAIVGFEKDPKKIHRRVTMFDFQITQQTGVIHTEQRIGFDTNDTAYWSLRPMETVTIGLGFNIDIPVGMAGFILPRGSLVSNSVMVVNNNPIDPGFGGEPVAQLLNFGTKEFRIYGNSRLVQLVLQVVWIGKLISVPKLKASPRGCGSNGSTGR